MNLQNTLDKKHWHAYDKEEIYGELKTSDIGLNQEEVNKRIQFYGENKLPQGRRITLLQIILHQLLNPLIFILIAAAVASVAIGEEKMPYLFF
ncbi:hypothetical protein LB452_06485 [Psychroflexus sp. CAK8W]|uniref:Cation-transporting P-type ATPase N-terminal domain-containing protein n=1 Tax=Psychroflexus longus TaxID=2873596 RepID=A0ABS7XL27_9FLAO|nr:cation-transporting P-type ATPase [Psychroflexus longus]MBZ9778566.1 hypothetical protein [Psychroflexus longus]